MRPQPDRVSQAIVSDGKGNLFVGGLTLGSIPGAMNEHTFDPMNHVGCARTYARPLSAPTPLFPSSRVSLPCLLTLTPTVNVT